MRMPLSCNENKLQYHKVNRVPHDTIYQDQDNDNEYDNKVNIMLVIKQNIGASISRHCISFLYVVYIKLS